MRRVVLGESDRLTGPEVDLIEAGVTLAAASERLAVLVAAVEWDEKWASDSQDAKREYVRAKVAFRLALVKLRHQGES